MKSKKSIFIVDLNPLASKGLSHLLRAGGYTIKFHSSITEFLNTIDPDESGCVVLDIGQPEISEKEQITKIMVLCKKLSIIIVSEDYPDNRRMARAINAAAFLRKPVDGPALLDTIDWTLRSDPNGKNRMESIAPE